MANRGGGTRWASVVLPGAPGSRVTRLELFYDLVFVFAFLTVTGLTASRPSWNSLFQALLVLALLWWCWQGFAGLGNLVRADQGVLPVVGFVMVAAIFLLVLSIPSAFVDQPGGFNGPLVFAVCYFLVRAPQLAVFGWVARSDPAQFRLWLRLAALPVVATALLVAAGQVPPRVTSGALATGLQLGLWAAAVLVEYVAGIILGGSYWVVTSAGHWAERHALMVLLALGESIIALGLGSKFGNALPLTGPVMTTAVLGIAIAAVLWWAYFDTLAIGIEHRLHAAREPGARARLARNAYTYLHLPMVAGVIFFALGLKDLLAESASPSTPPWGEAIGAFWITVLYGGVAVYLLSLAACVLLALRTVRWPLLVAVVAIVAVAPAAARLPELVAVVLLSVLCAAAVVVETLREDGRRRQIRQLALEEEVAAEAERSRWRQHHL
ncbi:low temperature requirement protein A [Micromonospora sp. DR5-3]|uniref:low temperature requirement protein A n=1 Tax=unclassified Micromonospora TaxID=2617518 RepID=UPI0011D6152E|nr:MULTISPECIES: low temperature requirement protein A [unclassified Micromonospora]MCW3817313.1 low temperature requirement protein A [Micromonospora sp. DR5-3]TYC24055.1 low temperature requirement protein A [Micromonospora sp. MP36]